MVLMSTLHTVLHLQPAQIGVEFSAAAARAPSPRLQLMQDAARYAAVDDLDAWVRASGGSGLDGVRVALSASGLGLETSRDVKRGDVLIGVPETLALTAEWTLRSAIGEALAAFDPELGDYTFLALGLLHERRMGAESPLAPWVASAVWPDDPDVPLLWDAGAQADLAASTSAPLAERLAGAAADYAWLEENALAADPGLFPRDGFSREAFLGALATAFSRSVIVRKDGFDLPALCPLLDLANHADDAPPGAAPRLYGAKSGGIFGKATAAVVELVASTELPEGAPLEVRYGGATAAELLLDYGFAPKRPEPAVSLAWTIEETDANYYDKLDVVEAAGLAESQPFVLREGEAPPAELLAFLRLRHLQGIDAFLLESIFRQVLWPEHLQLPVTENNERAAMKDGSDRCAAALAALSGDLQRDLAILAEAAPGSRAAELASIRYAERRALESAARWFDAQLELPASSVEYYQERRLRSLNLDPIETAEDLDALRAAGRAYSDNDW